MHDIAIIIPIDVSILAEVTLQKTELIVIRYLPNVKLIKGSDKSFYLFGHAKSFEKEATVMINNQRPQVDQKLTQTRNC